ncbi:hypothetical protein BDQ17DRAFT_1247609 [Cyathus striatus]|nr:hypothetical protein BDQ17DRAFT_1247609 [Cyathus striatus]
MPKGDRLRPLTKSEVASEIDELSVAENEPSSWRAMLLRKLKVERERRRAKLQGRHIESLSVPVTPLPPIVQDLPHNPEVIDALHDIKTTPFENSFLSRLHGSREPVIPALIAVDWETITPWMDLMSDIRDHYSFSNEQPAEASAPIVYTSLQPYHLPQVHDLLERIFWKGIDISDSLDYWPEKCTVIATYKKLVVGLAILSSPQETYITYLAVKAGWDKSQIARTMLYHLIMLNPSKDVTLHVSVNNSAMLLYNQFGFKAEEFVAGFYEDYLDPLSRASKNAFRLRLRQQ